MKYLPKCAIVNFHNFHTVQFYDFLITQILCEINFDVSKSARSAILTLLDALNCDFHEFRHYLKAEIDQIDKTMCSQNGKNGSFRT